MSYSPTTTISTVAQRELKLALRNKGILVTLAIAIILIVGGALAFNFFSNRDGEDATVIATVNAPNVDGRGITTREVSDRTEAEALVKDGEADVALVPGEGEWLLLEEGMPSQFILSHISAALETITTNQALTELGVDPAAFDAARGPTQVVPVDLSLDDDPATAIANVLVALAGIFIILYSVIMFAASTGSRVAEEKSSRVVEIIIATVRPVDFLAGKILGNVIAGSVFTLAIVAAAVLAVNFVDLPEEFSFNWVLIALLIAAYLLGMTFFGSLYAAAGSMVQRTEDLQSTQSPIIFLLLGTFYAPLFGFQHLETQLMQVVAWIPPFSLGVAPLQYAQGNMSLLEALASMALMALLALGAIILTAKIYQASILNNGKKMTWREVLKKRSA